MLLESELIRLGLGDEIFAAEALEKRVEQLEQKLAAVKRLAGQPGAARGGRPVPAAAVGPTAQPVSTPSARPTLVPSQSSPAPRPSAGPV